MPRSLVTTVRALKLHTGKYRVVPGRPLPDAMVRENPDDVHVGAANLRKQVENMQRHGVSPVICINHFASDHQSEIDAVFAVAKEMGVRCALSDHWAEGGAGATDLARAVVEAAEEPTEFQLSLRIGPADQGQDRNHCQGDLWRGRVSL